MTPSFLMLSVAVAQDQHVPIEFQDRRVPDLDLAHRTLQARGVEFTGAPHMIHKHSDGTEEWMAFFKDPEGRPLALMSQLKPG